MASVSSAGPVRRSASLARGDGLAERARDWSVQLDGMSELVDHRPRVVDSKLAEQVGNLAPLRSEDLVLGLEIPELALERPNRLLAARLDELLVGLAGLPLIGDLPEAPGLDLAME